MHSGDQHIFCLTTIYGVYKNFTDLTCLSSVGIVTLKSLEVTVVYQDFIDFISQLPVKYWNHWTKLQAMPDSSSSRYPTHILSHNHYHNLCSCLSFVVKQTPKQSNEYTVPDWYQDLTDLTCLSSVNLLESQRHGLVKSIQVPHTYSVSQSLPPYVYLCRNTHPKITRIMFTDPSYIPGLHYFYSLNFRQSDGITDLCQIQLHTGTPHIFCLTTTTIIRVFVKE